MYVTRYARAGRRERHITRKDTADRMNGGYLHGDDLYVCAYISDVQFHDPTEFQQGQHGPAVGQGQADGGGAVPPPVPQKRQHQHKFGRGRGEDNKMDLKHEKE